MTDFDAVDSRKCKSGNRVVFRAQHGQFGMDFECIRQLFSGVLGHVSLLFEQSDVLHGVSNGILRCRVIDTAQKPFCIDQPNRSNVVGFVWVSLNHKIFRDNAVDFVSVASQELPFAGEAIVAGVSLNILLKNLRGIVLWTQREAYNHDVSLVPVSEVGPQQLPSHLCHMWSVGAIKCCEPNFTSQDIT